MHVRLEFVFWERGEFWDFGDIMMALGLGFRRLWLAGFGWGFQGEAGPDRSRRDVSDFDSSRTLPALVHLILGFPKIGDPSIVPHIVGSLL